MSGADRVTKHLEEGAIALRWCSGGRLGTVKFKGRIGPRRGGEEMAFLLRAQYGGGNADSVFREHPFFHEPASLT